MNDLQAYFEANQGNQLHKWMHYFEIYDRHFGRFRETDVHILEIGVSHGGSLQMWKNYFGPKAKIFGVDVNPHCKKLEEENVRIFIGDQMDRAFLAQLKTEIPRVDILIDDGGHRMEQQINTFEILYPHVTENGVYLCEDLHTSYWKKWRGGYRAPGTFIEFSKKLIDSIHAWHTEEPARLPVSAFTRSTHGLHFYDSVLVIEKRPIGKPEVRITGKPTVPEQQLDIPGKIVLRAKENWSKTKRNLGG